MIGKETMGLWMWICCWKYVGNMWKKSDEQQKKMRRLVFSLDWDESESCEEPLSFIGVNDNGGK